jgi:TP901 family phage tail tape measure protein
VLDLAAGSLGQLTPSQAAGLASQAMKAFGLSIDEASISVDRMLQAVNVFALDASELPLALGTASRGAQALHQSLSETLISLGLVKNVVPGVERASTAVAVAMERMADPRVQQALRGVGVSVTDSQNRFRSFLDILGDLAPQLDRMSEAQRSAFLLSTFGREALGGVNAILTQVTNGVRTNSGETLRGAAAIAYLRDQFENAGGTAARFREQMLNTFEGQKQLLAGSLETLAIVAGEPFAQVFKPLVTIVVEVVNAVLNVFRQLPAPVKRAFAAFVVGAGAVVALVGAVIAAKAGFALLLIGLKAAGITLGGLMATILPAILIFGVLAAVVAGFVVAFRSNVGGIADFFARVWDRIKLAFRGLVQLFEQGGFSGAVREELNRAENAGLKTFLIRVYQIAFRIQRFFQGIGEGFSAAIEAAAPVFEAFVGALTRLGQALGLVAGESANAAAGIPSNDFAAFGRILGQIAGVLVEVFVGALTFVIDVVTSAINTFRSAMAPLQPVFDAVKNAVSLVFQELGKLGAMFGFTSSASGQAGGSLDALRSVAEFLGHGHRLRRGRHRWRDRRDGVVRREPPRRHHRGVPLRGGVHRRRGRHPRRACHRQLGAGLGGLQEGGAQHHQLPRAAPARLRRDHRGCHRHHRGRLRRRPRRGRRDPQPAPGHRARAARGRRRGHGRRDRGARWFDADRARRGHLHDARRGGDDARRARVVPHDAGNAPGLAAHHGQPPGGRHHARHRGPSSGPRHGHPLVLAGPGVLTGGPRCPSTEPSPDHRAACS